MGVAAGAPDLGPDRAHGAVLEQHHGITIARLIEARPAAVRLELGVRGEEPGAARATPVDALGLGVCVLAGERSLRPGLAQHAVLLRAEPLLPFILGQLHLFHAAENTRAVRARS